MVWIPWSLPACLFVKGVFFFLSKRTLRTLLPVVVEQDCPVCGFCRRCPLGLAMPGTLLTVKQRMAIKGACVYAMLDAFEHDDSRVMHDRLYTVDRQSRIPQAP